MDPVTVLVGVAGIILGWALKVLTDTFAWRRQQLLDAYLAFLNTGDHCTNEISKVWNEGQTLGKRDQAWVDHAWRVRELVQDVDAASGRVFLVASSAGGRAALEMYVATERMYRRAIAVPPRSWDNFYESSLQWVKAYHRVVDQAREEMAFTRWRDRMGSREERFELSHRLLKELNKEDPFPVAVPVEQSPPE